MHRGRLIALAALSICAAGCAPFASPAELRLERARALPAVQCDGAAARDRAARVLGTPGLLDVEPLTASLRTLKGYPDKHLVGARLRYAAPAGVTAAWYQRELECHEADVVLGRAPARGDDPYAAADEWLEIEVATVGSALVVDVRARDVDAAAAVAARAGRLLGAR